MGSMETMINLMSIQKILPMIYLHHHHLNPLNKQSHLIIAQFKQPPLLVQTTVQQLQVQITAQQHQVQIMAQQPHHSETTRDKKPDKKEGEDANSAGAGLVNVTADGVNKVDEVETDL